MARGSDDELVMVPPVAKTTRKMPESASGLRVVRPAEGRAA